MTLRSKYNFPFFELESFAITSKLLNWQVKEIKEYLLEVDEYLEKNINKYAINEHNLNCKISEYPSYMRMLPTIKKIISDFQKELEDTKKTKNKLIEIQYTKHFIEKNDYINLETIIKLPCFRY